MIRNIKAIEQPLDFNTIMPFCVSASDVDGILQLNNGLTVVLEIKKETPSHSAHNFSNTSQYSILRNLIANRSDILFIYATHTQEIDLNVPIDLGQCTVQILSLAGNALEITDETRNLAECIKVYSRHTYSNDDLYVMVKYPDGKMEYCIVTPKYKKWSTEYYDKSLHSFHSITEAKKYIEARFIQPYNKKNTYMLFKRVNGSDFLIDQFKYDFGRILLHE